MRGAMREKTGGVSEVGKGRATAVSDIRSGLNIGRAYSPAPSTALLIEVCRQTR